MSLVRQYKHWTLLLYHALRAPTIQIYMKSPSVVAGQDISGTVVIQHYQSTIFGVTVNVIGKEVNKQSHVFLKDTILQLDSTDMEHKLTLSFNHRLSDLLSGTYAHKKGSIQYYIQCELWYTRLGSIERVRVKKRFELYSNMSHYMNVDKPISFSSSHSDMSIDFYMPRTVWITDNTPIYIHLAIQNNALDHSINEIKLRLVKRFKQNKEIIATSSSLGWWQPLEPEQQDVILMTIRPPANEFTISQQGNMSVSFEVQAFTRSQRFKKDIMLANIPVILVHPMSSTTFSPPLLLQVPQIAFPPSIRYYPHKTLLGKMKKSISSWIHKSPSISSYASTETTSTARNVASFATEKVEIP